MYKKPTTENLDDYCGRGDTETQISRLIVKIKVGARDLSMPYRETYDRRQTKLTRESRAKHELSQRRRQRRWCWWRYKNGHVDGGEKVPVLRASIFVVLWSRGHDPISGIGRSRFVEETHMDGPICVPSNGFEKGREVMTWDKKVHSCNWYYLYIVQY